MRDAMLHEIGCLLIKLGPLHHEHLLVVKLTLERVAFHLHLLVPFLGYLAHACGGTDELGVVPLVATCWALLLLLLLLEDPLSPLSCLLHLLENLRVLLLHLPDELLLLQLLIEGLLAVLVWMQMLVLQQSSTLVQLL